METIASSKGRVKICSSTRSFPRRIGGQRFREDGPQTSVFIDGPATRYFSVTGVSRCAKYPRNGADDSQPFPTGPIPIGRRELVEGDSVGGIGQ